MMKIEAGKYYRTRDGRKVGPMVPTNCYRPEFTMTVEHEFRTPALGKAWRSDGSYSSSVGQTTDADLVSEWSESPVREVTRTEIVPGTYGKVVVKDSEVAFLILSFLSQYDEQSPWSFTWTADEARAAAAVLVELADALSSQP